MADPLPKARVCQKTGLALVASPAIVFRIARQSYGPFDPQVRDPLDNADDWSRFDTPGRTIYAANDKLTAYMELLAPYRTEIGAHRRALQPLADWLKKPLAELWEEILAEWQRTGHMHANWLPSVFRDGRAMYSLQFPEGWWVDVTATETISALHELFADEWPTSTGPISAPLTLSHLTSDDRVLTTAIATRLREDVTLDDDTLPIGTRFISKHGVPLGASGVSWAYWMRNVDEGLVEPTSLIASASIDEHDPDFTAAQKHCKIKSR
jgi:hypothetical protein